MAILQSVGIQPMQQGPPSDVKQEQQAGMQVRAYCCHRLSSLAGCAMRCAGHVQALLTEASAGVLRSCSLLKQAPSSSQGRACTEQFTREPAYEGLAACSLKLETDAVPCTLQAPMLAGEMEHMDSTPAPSGQWASQGSMPSMQQVRLLSPAPTCASSLPNSQGLDEAYCRICPG